MYQMKCKEEELTGSVQRLEVMLAKKTEQYQEEIQLRQMQLHQLYSVLAENRRLKKQIGVVDEEVLVPAGKIGKYHRG